LNTLSLRAAAVAEVLFQDLQAAAALVDLEPARDFL